MAKSHRRFGCAIALASAIALLSCTQKTSTDKPDCPICHDCSGSAPVPLADGTHCTDSLYCTVDDVCMNGECVGTPRVCPNDPACPPVDCDESKNACVSSASATDDSDRDGICNAIDRCPGSDDKQDKDNDGVPDGCDRCDGYDDLTPLRLAWPIAGREGHAWVINNYLDHDPAVGAIRDHTGATGMAAKTYDGHRGIDIDIADFRAMDRGVPVHAMSPGTVEFVHNGEFDRQTTLPANCDRMANMVGVRTATGHLILYLHLRLNSIAVQDGQRIETGQMLGLVGSSGCSSWPHLHIEITDCKNVLVDPMESQLFIEPPAYDFHVGLMDVYVRRGGVSSVDQLRDAMGDDASFTTLDTFGIGVILGGGLVSDRISFELVQGDGTVFSAWNLDFDQTYRRSVWYWNRTLDGVPGTWYARVALDGVATRTATLTVNP